MSPPEESGALQDLARAVDALSEGQGRMSKGTKVFGGGMGALVVGLMGLLYSELSSIKDEITNLKIEASHHVLLEQQILDLRKDFERHQSLASHGRVTERLSLVEQRLDRLEQQ